MLDDYENDTDPEKDDTYSLVDCKKEWWIFMRTNEYNIGRKY